LFQKAGALNLLCKKKRDKKCKGDFPLTFVTFSKKEKRKVPNRQSSFADNNNFI